MTNPASFSKRKCPQGHDIDPNWTTCPTCEAEKRAHRERGGPKGVVPSGQRKTTVGTVPPAEGRRETRAMPQHSAPKPGGHEGKGETRRIVGVLITYTWHDEGELSPVREGKTFIGSGDVSSEAYHRACDVQIVDDKKMSGEHALILCRQGNYEIIDQTSSNGTFLNDKMLRSNLSTELKSYDKIRTGLTEWTFIRIKAPETVVKVSEPATPAAEPSVVERDPGDSYVR